MRVISICNSKGGVGKTTIARALAVLAAEEGQRVALVDLDPQGTLSGWWERRGAPDNPSLMRNAPGPADAVEALGLEGYDFIVFDTAPAFLHEMTEALTASDFAILPTRPDVDNIKSTRDAIVLARKAKTPFLVVINQASSQSKQPEQTQAALKAAGVDIADTIIFHRISHSQASDTGRAVVDPDMKDRGSKAAAAEMRALWAEIKAAVEATPEKHAEVRHGDA